MRFDQPPDAYNVNKPTGAAWHQARPTRHRGRRPGCGIPQLAHHLALGQLKIALANRVNAIIDATLTSTSSGRSSDLLAPTWPACRIRVEPAVHCCGGAVDLVG